MALTGCVESGDKCLRPLTGISASLTGRQGEGS